MTRPRRVDKDFMCDTEKRVGKQSSTGNKWRGFVCSCKASSTVRSAASHAFFVDSHHIIYVFSSLERGRGGRKRKGKNCFQNNDKQMSECLSAINLERHATSGRVSEPLSMEIDKNVF